MAASSALLSAGPALARGCRGRVHAPAGAPRQSRTGRTRPRRARASRAAGGAALGHQHRHAEHQVAALQRQVEVGLSFLAAGAGSQGAGTVQAVADAGPLLGAERPDLVQLRHRVRVGGQRTSQRQADAAAGELLQPPLQRLGLRRRRGRVAQLLAKLAQAALALRAAMRPAPASWTRAFGPPAGRRRRAAASSCAGRPIWAVASAPSCCRPAAWWAQLAVPLVDPLQLHVLGAALLC